MLDKYQAFFSIFYFQNFNEILCNFFKNKKIFLYINYYIINTLINDKTYILY